MIQSKVVHEQVNTYHTVVSMALIRFMTSESLHNITLSVYNNDDSPFTSVCKGELGHCYQHTSQRATVEQDM